MADYSRKSLLARYNGGMRGESLGTWRGVQVHIGLGVAAQDFSKDVFYVLVDDNSLPIVRKSDNYLIVHGFLEKNGNVKEVPEPYKYNNKNEKEVEKALKEMNKKDSSKKKEKEKKDKDYTSTTIGEVAAINIDFDKFLDDVVNFDYGI